MREAGGVDSFLEEPAGRHLTGDGWLYFCRDEALYGFVLWGRPNEESIARLVRVLEVEARPAAKPHASYVDARRLEGVDAAAFQVLTAYLVARMPAFSRLVTRQALVRPAGIPGAVVAGFYKVLQPGYLAQDFAGPMEALRWLGVPGEALAKELDDLHAGATAPDPTVRALRAMLSERVRKVTLPEAAKVLGLSSRSLQRKLQAAGTAFQAELNAAQVRAALPLLLDTDRKLSAVALEVGCSSLQHFDVLFRKQTGESPSQWRAKRRG